MIEGVGEPFDASVTLSAVWSNLDDVPVLPANAFLLQLGAPGPDGRPDPAIVTVGFLAPPALTGTPEEQAAMLAALGAVSIRAHAKYLLTRPRLQELIQYLQGLADNWDRLLQAVDGIEGGEHE
jgi:hypothetical protein